MNLLIRNAMNNGIFGKEIIKASCKPNPLSALVNMNGAPKNITQKLKVIRGSQK